MLRFAIPVLGLVLMMAAIPASVRAQGQGGYAPGCAGAETARMSAAERDHARSLHQTNDTNGGRSSIDKSCKTWEGGGTIAGPQPGAIDWGQTSPHMRNLQR